jgi:site-specific recombinase XerD
MNIFSKKMQMVDMQIAEYLNWCEFNAMMTCSTMVTKRKAIERFLSVNPNINDLSKLTNEQFDQWRADLAKGGLAGKTINNYADHITGAIRFLRDRKEVRVAINLNKIDRAMERDGEMPYFTHDDMMLIKQNCYGPREKILISLLYDSGLRISEAANLKIKDVKECTVTIIGKGGKRRTTFILPETRQELDKWLHLNDITDGYIFPSPTKFGEPLSIQQIRSSINSPINRAGLKGSAHTIRHSFTTRLIDGGADILTASAVLGHADTRTTQGYYHRHIDTLAKKFESAMSVLTKA